MSSSVPPSSSSWSWEEIEMKLNSEGKLPSPLKSPSTTPDDNNLNVPYPFSFPFKPYDIQEQFMSALFTSLEERKLGIFESPTGTGKSLSLLCGSLSWLQTREDERVEYLKSLIASVDVIQLEKQEKQAEDWIKAQVETRRITNILAKAKRELVFHEGLRAKRKQYLKKRVKVGKPQYPSSSVGKKNKDSKGHEDMHGKKIDDGEDIHDLMINDELFAPVNYSDSEGEDNEEQGDVEEPEFYPYRVIFASRTHSQIGQFANELKRTKFANEVTAVSLASRQNLCVNQEVAKLKTLSLINERCLDLQKSSKGKQTSESKKMKGCSGCPYFNYSAIEELKHEILSVPMDIEDLINAGKEHKACPYYASRKASKEAQLLLVPYNTILHSGTRNGVGLKMENSAILLDEAHNIIESISNMYSNTITFQQLQDCSEGLKIYMRRYMSRFTPKNLLKLKQVSFILKSFSQYLGKAGDNESKVMSIHQFRMDTGIDNLDLHELAKFIRTSKLMFKLKGYILHQERIAEKEKQAATEVQIKDVKTPKTSTSLTKNKGKENKKSNATHPPASKKCDKEVKKKSFAGQAVLNFCEFFKSLLTFDAEGRIILERKVFKFLLLNTAEHFQDLIKSARSIILAGGTMKPYNEVEDQLFQSCKERIYHFSCDHIIPDENLVCVALSRGPSGALFDFTYKNRNTPALMEELCRTLVNLSKIVPGGFVCFLPSYDYEASLFSYLESSGSKDKIEMKKKIFREPKDSNCDLLLTEYTRQVKNNPNGAMLLAVVGGKLSEGINFSDDLGRCVAVVGLPYPNITSLEIKEKIKFASERFGEETGNQLLSTMCAKAVNQSIGRAIRHSQDYAAILLIDHRFNRPNQVALLPNWIQKRFLPNCDNFGQAVKAMSQFFNGKKSPG